MHCISSGMMNIPWNHIKMNSFDFLVRYLISEDSTWTGWYWLALCVLWTSNIPNILLKCSTVSSTRLQTLKQKPKSNNCSKSIRGIHENVLENHRKTLQKIRERWMLSINSQILDETVASLVSSPQRVDLFYKRSALRCETRCALGATFRGSEVLKAIRGMHGTIPEQALLWHPHFIMVPWNKSWQKASSW